MQLKNICAHTDTGPFLEINEDGYDFDLNNQLFMIFDGFGGAGVGDVVVRTLKENITKFYSNFAIDPDSTFPFFYGPKFLLEGNALINSMLYSHNLIMQDNFTKEMNRRGGASALIGCIAESVLTLSCVGNCNAYLYRKGLISKIFSEDSFVHLSNDSYDGHLKTMPLSGFGLFPDLYYQIKELRIFNDDKVIFMTDGVYARILEDELKDIINRNNIDNKEKINELCQLANSRGNLDNQTIMILDF